MMQFEMLFQPSVGGLNCIAGSHSSKKKQTKKTNQTRSERVNHYFKDLEKYLNS